MQKSPFPGYRYFMFFVLTTTRIHPTTKRRSSNLKRRASTLRTEVDSIWFNFNRKQKTLNILFQHNILYTFVVTSEIVNFYKRRRISIKIDDHFRWTKFELSLKTKMDSIKTPFLHFNKEQLTQCIQLFYFFLLWFHLRILRFLIYLSFYHFIFVSFCGNCIPKAGVSI